MDPEVRILIVDDHAIVRFGLSQLLASASEFLVVGEAEDGAAAVAAARSLRPDVVLVDYSMPHMNGADATRQMLAESPELRVIGMSNGIEGPEAAMLDAGAVAFVPKEHTPHLLISTIRRAIEAGK